MKSKSTKPLRARGVQSCEAADSFWKGIKPASRRQALRELQDPAYQPQLLVRTLEKWRPVREAAQCLVSVLDAMNPDSLEDLCNPAWHRALASLDGTLERCAFRLNRLDEQVICRCFALVHQLDDDIQTLFCAQHSRCRFHLTKMLESNRSLLRQLDQWEEDVKILLSRG